MSQSRSNKLAQSNELGQIRCSLRGTVSAGSWHTCQLTYTAGHPGIDDTGSIKIVFRYATDSGTPQFNDPLGPNYTTAVASNGAHLQLRYDVKDNTRPWGKTLHVKVLQGYLRANESITITFGDQSKGSPGWRMQTFAEDTFELKTLVDRYATYVYDELPKSPRFKVVAGEPARLVAVAPSQVQINKKFSIRLKREDAWGNPVGKAWKLSSEEFGGERFSVPGIQRIEVSDSETGLKAQTNPIVVAEDIENEILWADIHGQSEETIGTNTIDQYFKFARDLAFVDVCGHQGNDFQITDDFWQTINDTTRKFNRSGKFIAFPGWEWSGNTGLGGDRNVFFKDEGGIISRSSRALVDVDQSNEECSSTVEQLFDRMESVDRDVMLVPHVGGRYADLARHSSKLEPVVEVHSAWGTFEWMLDDAFSRGYRIGIVANSDGHKGRPGASYPGASTFGSYGGLTCVIADEFSRDSVWQAYQDRRVYATTGARIVLQVSTDQSHAMGQVVEIDEHSIPRFTVSVAGTSNIERVEIRNAMRVLKTFRPYGEADLSSRLKVVWQGATVRGRGRQVNWDGELKLTGNRIKSFETINFWNLEKRCEQVSPKKLSWESLTTGGVAGVIVELEKPAAGSIQIETTQKSLRAGISKLGANGRSASAGGLDKKISAYRLQPKDGHKDFSFDYSPSWKSLNEGDNPIYVCVVQEDGNMAWSSPIYLVKSS
jgi:hypothetical protein